MKNWENISASCHSNACWRSVAGPFSVSDNNAGHQGIILLRCPEQVCMVATLVIFCSSSAVKTITNNLLCVTFLTLSLLDRL